MQMKTKFFSSLLSFHCVAIFLKKRDHISLLIYLSTNFSYAAYYLSTWLLPTIHSNHFQFRKVNSKNGCPKMQPCQIYVLQLLSYDQLLQPTDWRALGPSKAALTGKLITIETTLKKIRKISNKQPNLPPKRIGNRTNKI